MGQVQWRMPQVRFLRVAPHGNARHVDAKGIERVYRFYSSRPRPSKLKRDREKTSGIVAAASSQSAYEARNHVRTALRCGLSKIVARLTVAASTRIANEDERSLYKSPP
jgi:hypothetical protein